jgi:hypothetical protein
MHLLLHGGVTDTAGLYLLHQCQGCLFRFPGFVHQYLRFLMATATEVVTEGTIMVADQDTRLRVTTVTAAGDTVVGTTDKFIR